MTGREALKILQDGWIQVVQLKTDDEESTKENIKAQEAYAYIVELLKQKDETILDKIRAEIERERSFQRVTEEYDIATGLRKALEIIDKYKAGAGSEGEE